jgi:hypothetical protein
MAGYSGTPLRQKLGIKPGFKITLNTVPADVKRDLRDAIAACEKDPNQAFPLDLVLEFVTSRKELRVHFAGWIKKLAPAGMLWIAWPKKSSGVETDLDENRVREIGLAAGLVDVKVCAINEIWSGLKFVRRVKDRPR